MNPAIGAQVTRTPAGRYIVIVAWRYERAPLDTQVEFFEPDDLKVISPSQLAFARTTVGDGTFERYSRTTGDVFYDERNNQFVIFPEGTIRDLVGIINIVDAHRQRKEYVIPEHQIDGIYGIADVMLKGGTAIAVKPGRTNVDTSRFEEVELTNRLYSNRNLGFKAGDYGNFLKDNKGRDTQSFFLDDESYAKSQNGPYVKGLCVYGPLFRFDVLGENMDLGDNRGAFGVRFEKVAEGGAKQIHQIQKL